MGIVIVKAAARTRAVLHAARTEGAAPLAAERDHFLALVNGSRALLVRPYRWCKAGEGADTLWRAVGLTWAVAAAAWIVWETPALLVVVVLGWGYTALRLAPAPPPAKINKEAEGTGEPPDDDATETAEGGNEPPDDAAFLAGVADLIGDRNGVLLRVIAAHFQEAVAEEYGIPDVRAQCAALGIPVRPKLKASQGVSPGVHRDDFRAALTALTEGPHTPSPDTEPAPAPETGSAPG